MATANVLLLLLCFLARRAAGDYGSWQSAHATFYGGGDASGTMGKCCSIASSDPLARAVARPPRAGR
jgi:hypothetical protein